MCVKMDSQAKPLCINAERSYRDYRLEACATGRLRDNRSYMMEWRSGLTTTGMSSLRNCYCQVMSLCFIVILGLRLEISKIKNPERVRSLRISFI